MEERIFIIGHQNPDTDSICSAIAYAFLKRKQSINAVPVRIGRINHETQFVLDYFGVPEPELISNVKTQAYNLNMDVIKPVSPDTSIKDAWRILTENRLSVLPVAGQQNTLAGIISASDIANAYMDMPHGNTLALSRTPVKNVINSLNAKLIYDSKRSFSESENVVVAAMSPHGMSSFIKNGDIVLVGDRSENQKRAVELGAFCIILTCGSPIDPEVIELSKKTRCSIIVTDYDTFTASRLLYQSVPVSYFMTSKNIVYFHSDDYLGPIREKMLQTRFRNYPVLDESDHFVGFISRYHLINAKRKKVILVDHGERSQSAAGIDEAEILEIIDHHRIGDVQTDSPIYYLNEPVGSTATIVSNLFFKNGINPPPEIAGILCAAIISDTVAFKSPTGTKTDLATAERLAGICNINISDFAARMFKAGSALKDMSPEKIFKNDYKEYLLNDRRIGIGQLNTTDSLGIVELRGFVLDYMKEYLQRGGYDLLMLLITDILKEETEVIFVEAKKGIEKAFGPLKDENSFIIKGVVSRKKQIVPVLKNLYLS